MHPELATWAEQNLGVAETFSLGVLDRIWAQRYAIAIDDLNPLYFDEDFARRAGYRGIIAPPNYLATLRGPMEAGAAQSDLLADGMSPSARPPLGSLKAMGGGQKLTFHTPAYCGETIVVQRQVIDLSEKPGRNGLLIIIKDQLQYANHLGEPKLTLDNTLLCSWTDQQP